jgi:hypothetical protein
MLQLRDAVASSHLRKGNVYFLALISVAVAVCVESGVPPVPVVEAIVFKLEIVNYELGRTKTANIEDPTFNGNSSAEPVPSLPLPMSSARFLPRVSKE